MRTSKLSKLHAVSLKQQKRCQQLFPKQNKPNRDTINRKCSFFSLSIRKGEVNSSCLLAFAVCCLHFNWDSCEVTTVCACKSTSTRLLLEIYAKHHPEKGEVLTPVSSPSLSLCLCTRLWHCWLCCEPQSTIGDKNSWTTSRAAGNCHLIRFNWGDSILNCSAKVLQRLKTDSIFWKHFRNLIWIDQILAGRIFNWQTPQKRSRHRLLSPSKSHNHNRHRHLLRRRRRRPLQK